MSTSSSPVRALAHVCFRTADLDAAEAFYCGRLGLQKAFDFVNDQGVRFGFYLRVGGRSFLEFFAGDIAQESERKTYQHLCLEVDDIQSAVATFRARGVEVSDPLLGSDNSWQAWLSDPEGNRIELHHYTPQSRQTPHLG